MRPFVRQEIIDSPDGDPSTFLRPAGVVVVGVSREPAKPGHVLARNLLRSGYQGAIHFVNPSCGTLFDRRVFESIEEVPDPVDLAVILVAAPSVPGLLRCCGKRGIRAAIIESGGFGETGETGHRLEAECAEIAQAFGMRLMGPNCIGVIDTHAPLDLTFLGGDPPLPGDVAFLSQSGAICAAALDRARGPGEGLSHLISLGNGIDVTEADFLPLLADDPNARVIALYLEGVEDGARFVAACKDASRKKPIVALKVGRSEAGRRAVISHTGSLAGREAAYDAAFHRAGVIPAGTMQELFDWSRTLARCPLPAGPGVAILTNAGGPGAAAADAVAAAGLELAILEAETEKALRAFLPPAAGVSNPVDMLATATPEHFAQSLRLLLADPGVHSAIVIFPPPPVSDAGEVARALVSAIAETDRPVIVCPMGDGLVREATEILRTAGIPDFPFPEPAAAALGMLARRADRLRQHEDEVMTLTPCEREDAASILDHTSGLLFQEDAMCVVRDCGISTLCLSFASGPADAVRHARELGYPVALKVAAPDVSHKTDTGGVLLGLKDDDAVRAGFEAIVRSVRKALPGTAINGVYVQRMAPKGQEVIVGVVRDEQFGPLVMFGGGGVEVEAERDVAFALAPLSRADAERMIAATRAGRMLRGSRGRPPADREAVIDALCRIAALAAALPQAAEIEINPLRVMEQGSGVCAVDVRIRVEQSSYAEPLK